MAKEHLILGKRGEEEAVKLLKQQGYKIITRNYKSKFGEIDIIASDKDTICFVEVKARSSDRFGQGMDAVLFKKQRQITRAAINYLKVNNLLDNKARFDVVSIMFFEGVPKIDLIKNAFELDEKSGY